MIGPRTMLFGAVAVIVLVAAISGYLLGRSHENRAHVQEMLDLQNAYLEERERADENERARLILQSERDRLARDLENAASIDPDAGRVSLPARVLQRLGAR